MKPASISAALFLALTASASGHFPGAGSFSPVSSAHAQRLPAKLTREQAEAVAAYDAALAEFKRVLAERRSQIDGNAKLASRPGQDVYLARVKVMSTYKDLTDAIPERIGPPNRFDVPPAYFDKEIEPLIEEYAALFKNMQAPPKFAQASNTPFKDVYDIGRAIGLAKGLDKKTADAAGRISLGIFFAETNGNQNIGNGRSKTYKGSLQTGPKENTNGKRKWNGLKERIAKVAPDVAKRDAKEAARARGIDERYNHWVAVRNGLMNAHADLFAQLPEITRVLPDEIDQMKFFQLIQIVPTPTRAALNSGDFMNYRITSPRVMGYLRNNSMFAFGKKERAKTSATYREILDAMWLFESKFKKAQAKYSELKSGQES
ncbi:hypothetical protein [Hyphomicrobium sulfonivorans]|uniref:hypothetical protein n=1 Tax=Hyphomicrobium sulfonivorans TaxID=121290 RepID=UPI00156DE4E7|nr:hypothetical protein [Hyphomicrobium sulfonivorans]MBI1651058.1 hypothetical protein [Hyphomicrobium sulfonivorans]NSL72559.1 hypothetical protein [Hyphomicrobium sulfonivorans]